MRGGGAHDDSPGGACICSEVVSIESLEPTCPSSSSSEKSPAAQRACVARCDLAVDFAGAGGYRTGSKARSSGVTVPMLDVKLTSGPTDAAVMERPCVCAELVLVLYPPLKKCDH
jgi:hypothetical protein